MSNAVPERRLSEIAVEALGFELEEARKAGTLGYMARVFAQVTLPHSKVTGPEYVRRNGLLTLSVLAPSTVGIPYGSIPRLLLAWVTTEAVRSKEPELVLGDHLAGFMRQLDLVPTGGRWGTIPRLRKQMQSLFASTVSCSVHDPGRWSEAGFRIASGTDLWWDPKAPNQAALWQSTVTLSPDFFAEIVRRPVPVDMAALRALRRSPLALDFYVWLTHRMSYLRQPTTVPWAALQAQFGADYGDTYDFRKKARLALAKVHAVYDDARFEPEVAYR
jgi:hypothetical protein